MSATPLITVELGGKTRTLRYTNRALVRMDDELHKGAGNIRTVNVMVWAGLLHEDPKLTVDQVIDMIEPDQYETLSTAASKALGIAQGTASENGTAEGNVAATD